MLPAPVRRRRRGEGALSPVERAWDRLLSPWWGELPTESELIGAYPAEITEDEDAVYVNAEMPGFGRDEISVSCDSGVLHISAERTPEEAEGTTHLNERQYTRVERSFSLPAPVDEEKSEAKLEDGVLKLKLPKTEESKPRRIEIQ